MDRRCESSLTTRRGRVCARSCLTSRVFPSRSSCCSPSAPTTSETSPRATLAAVSQRSPARRGPRRRTCSRTAAERATASPTIILESGAFGTSADWGWMLRDLSAAGRVCAYDRAGLGRSAPNDLGVGVVDRAQRAGAPARSDRRDRPGDPDRSLQRGPLCRGLRPAASGAGGGAGLHQRRNHDARDDPRLIADLTAERRMANASVTVARLGLAPLVADKLVADSDAPAPRRRRQAARPHLPRLPGGGARRGPGDRPGPCGNGRHRRRGDPRHPDGGDHQHLRGPDPVGEAWRVSEEKSAARAARSWILKPPAPPTSRPSPATATTSTRR